MPLRDWLFESPEPTLHGEAWWFEVRGQRTSRHGPFAGRHEAELARHRLFQRFNGRARARGGWAWRSTAERWVVTLPPDVDGGGLPLSHAPCSSHRIAR